MNFKMGDAMIKSGNVAFTDYFRDHGLRNFLTLSFFRPNSFNLPCRYL